MRCDKRSPKSFFTDSFAQKRAKAAHMISLCSANQGAPNDTHVDLEVTLRSRDLRSTVDLDLMKSSYAYFDAYQ